MIVDDNPETIVLGDLHSPLRVGLAIDAHVVVVNCVSTIRVEIDSYSIVSDGFHSDQ